MPVRVPTMFPFLSELRVVLARVSPVTSHGVPCTTLPPLLTYPNVALTSAVSV